MGEEAKEIKVKLKPMPSEPASMAFDIKSNATVSELEKKVQNKLRDFGNVSMGILKFNGKELDNKDKTLAELDIKDGSSVENENRVVLIKTLTGKTIYITFNENTTVREFLKKLKDKEPNWNYIRLIYEGNALPRSTLDKKLLGYQIGNSSINYGTTLHLVVTSVTSENSDVVFDLNNLEESKNSNLVKVSETLKTDNNVFNLGRLDNDPRISSDSKKESKNSNYPPFRIIVGIADLLLLAAAVATFLLFFLSSLSLSIAIPIVLTVLFVIDTILFFGWNTILPKTLLDNCLKKPNLENALNGENKDKIEKIGNNKDNNPKVENKEKEKEEEYD